MIYATTQSNIHSADPSHKNVRPAVQVKFLHMQFIIRLLKLNFYKQDAQHRLWLRRRRRRNIKEASLVTVAFDQLGMGNIFVNKHRRRFTRDGRFSLSWPWNDPLKVIQGKTSLRILNPLYQVPISVPDQVSMGLSLTVSALWMQNFFVTSTNKLDNRYPLSDKGDAAHGVALIKNVTIII
jgi:hypothetical protein